MTAKQVLQFKHAFVKRQFVLVVDKTKMGEALRKARTDAGVSLRAMAKHIGCSAPFLSDVEAGYRQLNIGHLKAFLERCV